MSAFLDQHRDRFGVEPICREIEVSASAYRARRSARPSARAVRDEYLLNQIRRVHADAGGIYGQLKIWDELNNEAGIKVARCTVERLMRREGIEGCRNGKAQRTTVPGPSPVAADDLVRRDFTADHPDAVWLADFTYIRTWEGWGYLAVVLDVHTRRIVGWNFANHMRQSLVTEALEMAIAAKRDDRLTIAHSDNGSQYTSYEYTERLKRAGIAPSRGRTGTALDNAMAESIMSTLKRELTKRYTWRTRLDLELALVSYIGWYNARRKHRSLKVIEDGRTRRLTPLQALERYNQEVAALCVASK